MAASKRALSQETTPHERADTRCIVLKLDTSRHETLYHMSCYEIAKRETGGEFWRGRLDALARDDRCLVDLRGGRRVHGRRGRGQLDPARDRWRCGGQVLVHELRRQTHLAAPAANADAGYDRRNDDRRSTVQDEYE